MSRDVAEGILPIEILHLYSVNESKIDIIKCELICIYCYLDIQIFGCQIFAINYQSKNNFVPLSRKKLSEQCEISNYLFTLQNPNMNIERHKN